VIQERVEKEKYYIILKVLCKENYINTLRRVDALIKKEIKKILHLDLSSASRKPIVEEEKKKISKDVMITKQSTKRKVTPKEKKLLKKLKASA